MSILLLSFINHENPKNKKTSKFIIKSLNKIVIAATSNDITELEARMSNKTLII